MFPDMRTEIHNDLINMESVLFFKFPYIMINSFIFRASGFKSFDIFPEIGKLLGFPTV